MIQTAKYCRETNTPYLGLCLGMQIMSIEFARYIYKNNKYTSEEFDEEEKLNKKYYVIHFLPDQNKTKDKGGTLRLGAYQCNIIPGTKTEKIYKTDKIYERHRHRYEFNNKFKEDFEKNGLIASGIYKKENLVEILENKKHQFMIGTQFHPEFLSRPQKPHPLFYKFIETSKKNKWLNSNT